MKMQWMLSLAMVVGISACTKSEKKTTKMYGYSVSEYTRDVVKCKAEHWFKTEAERCAALPNDSLNNFCNPEGRASLFESNNCDKSLAVNSSIKQYFADSPNRPTSPFRLSSRHTPGRTYEFELDEDGCWKGENAKFNVRAECKLKYPQQ